MNAGFLSGGVKSQDIVQRGGNEPAGLLICGDRVIMAGRWGKCEDARAVEEDEVEEGGMWDDAAVYRYTVGSS